MVLELITWSRNGVNCAGTVLSELKIWRSAPNAGFQGTVEKIAKCKIGKSTRKYMLFFCFCKKHLKLVDIVKRIWNTTHWKLKVKSVSVSIARVPVISTIVFTPSTTVISAVCTVVSGMTVTGVPGISCGISLRFGLGGIFFTIVHQINLLYVQLWQTFIKSNILAFKILHRLQWLDRGFCFFLQRRII